MTKGKLVKEINKILEHKFIYGVDKPVILDNSVYTEIK